MAWTIVSDLNNGLSIKEMCKFGAAESKVPIYNKEGVKPVISLQGLFKNIISERQCSENCAPILSLPRVLFILMVLIILMGFSSSMGLVAIAAPYVPAYDNPTYELSVPNGITGQDIVDEARSWTSKGIYSATYNSSGWDNGKGVARRSGYNSYIGESGLSFDCSGFVSRVLNDVGFRGNVDIADCVYKVKYGNYISSDMCYMFRYGECLNDILDKVNAGDYSDLQPGDILGWCCLHDGGGATNNNHIVIYAGDGKMVEFTYSQGYRDTNMSVYNGRFVRAARYVPKNGGSDGSGFKTLSYENTTYTVTNDFNLKRQPYSDSEVMGTYGVGDTLSIKRVVLNDYNNVWVQVNTGGYVYAGYKYENGTFNQSGTQYLSLKAYNPVITINDPNMPNGTLAQGAGFEIRGTIDSSNSLQSVVAEVYNGNTRVAASNTWNSGNKITKSHYLFTSVVNSTLKFGSLPAGNYTFKLNATYYYDRGTKTATKTIWTSSFSISEGGTSPEPTADTLQFIDVYYPKQYAISNTGYWLEGGTIASNADLQTLKTEIYDANGTRVSYATHQLSGKSVSIKVFDDGSDGNGLRFSQIKTVGNCRWVLTATDSAGRTLTMEMPFWADYYSSTTSDKMSKKYSSSISVTGASLDLDEVMLRENQTTTLTVTVSPSNATNQGVSWSSNNSAVATVEKINDRQATVKAIKGGTAVITCTTDDSGKTATCAVTVKTSVTGLTLSPTSLQLEAGTSSTLNATVEPSNATNKIIHWDTGNSSIATVSSDGVVKGVAVGTTEISAMTEDGGFTQSCTVTVVAPAIKVTKITLSSSILSLKNGDTATLTATVAPSNATNKSVTWNSNNAAVASVSGGVVKAVGVGTATITCTAADGSGTKATCTVTVPEDAISDFILPSALKEIDEEAFAGIDAKQIILPDGIQKIGKRAFAGCKQLKYIYIPAATTQIAGDAFNDVASDFEIHGKLNSYAQTYASQEGYTFIADDACTITFNANGGACSITSKTVEIGVAIGTLPTASWAYYTFNGWYTSASGGSKVSGSSIFSSSTTLYAHWIENAWSDWVEASALPGGDILTESKTQYRYQDANYSDWSDWSGWDENRQSTSELKQEDSATVWFWYRYVCPNCGKAMHVYDKCYSFADGCNSYIGSGNLQCCWLPVSSSGGTQNWLGTGRVMYGSNSYDRWFYWVDSSQGYPNGRSTTGYRYRTRTKSWGSWSGWTDTAVSASTTRNVETRTVYRYKVK